MKTSHALAAVMLAVTLATAQAQGVRPEVGKPLQQASELLRAGKAKEALAKVREAENAHLLQQSGADSVVVSSETAGRLLGIAKKAPAVVELMEDMLTPDAGLAIAEKEVDLKQVGGSPRHLPMTVLGVIRDGDLLRIDDPKVDAMEPGDRLLYIRSADDEDE